MKKLSMEELERLSVQEYKETQKSPLILVLDNVRSLNNVGSAFRTGDAFRVEKIYLCGITGTPPHLTHLQSQGDSELDQLAFANQIPLGILSATLLSLEFEGIIKSLPGKKYKLLG